MQKSMIQLIALMTALSVTPSWSAEPTDQKPPSSTPVPGSETQLVDTDASAILRKQADTSAAEGMQAMREADADPHRGVDAAISFSHARAVYSKLGDVDAVCEMNADIYWCKKRMNLDNLQDYVAKKGDVAKQDFTAAQEVITKTAPLEEASAYFDRAEKYRLANPDHHFEIAIRYSEIVERFPDTAQGHDASQIFIKEQSLYLSQVEHEHAQEQALLQRDSVNRSSRFTTPPSIATGELTPIPDQQALSTARARVKKAYHDDLLNISTEAKKRQLGRRIAKEAEQSRDDASIYYIMLEESKSLASDSEDYETILTDIEHQGLVFKDYDQSTAKKSAFYKLQSKPVAAAILKLLNEPTDQAANLMVGKFYCYNLHQWDAGIKMLALCGAPAITKIAEMELAQPKNSPEQRATADAWFSLGKQSGGTDRFGAYQRAEYWYNTCEPFLTGVNKMLVDKNLDEIAKIVPETIADWSNINEQQWNRLRGKDFTIDARMGRTDTGISLGDGQKIHLCACPTDHWKWSTNDNQVFECDPTGGTPDFPRPRGRRNNGGNAGNSTFNEGSISMAIDDGPRQALGLATGPGRVFVQPENSWNLFGSGEIRVKAVKVPDEE